LRVVRERPTFVKAQALRGGESVVVQWVQRQRLPFLPPPASRRPRPRPPPLRPGHQQGAGPRGPCRAA
jgi:hypothetical protein